MVRECNYIYSPRNILRIGNNISRHEHRLKYKKMTEVQVSFKHIHFGTFSVILVFGTHLILLWYVKCSSKLRKITCKIIITLMRTFILLSLKTCDLWGYKFSFPDEIFLCVLAFVCIFYLITSLCVRLYVFRNYTFFSFLKSIKHRNK